MVYGMGADDGIEAIISKGKSGQITPLDSHTFGQARLPQISFEKKPAAILYVVRIKAVESDNLGDLLCPTKRNCRSTGAATCIKHNSLVAGKQVHHRQERALVSSDRTRDQSTSEETRRK